MRFNLAWAHSAAQNVTLKASLLILGFVTIALAITTARLAMRTPLIIERPSDRSFELGCSSHSVETSTGHTSSEIDAFVREALRQRFNSDAKPIPTYLSNDEESARSQEQKEFTNRSMTQTVIPRNLKVADNTITVEADRLISVGLIRSAFSFPLTVTMSSTPRTETNPYGLQLIKVVSPKTDTEGNKNESNR